jgi:hypothetical protein
MNVSLEEMMEYLLNESANTSHSLSRMTYKEIIEEYSECLDANMEAEIG